MFGDIEEAYWLSKIPLPKDTQDNISGSFNVEIIFKYLKNLEKFDILHGLFQRRKEKSSCNDNLMGENILMDKLILMNNIPGLADKSENFANFLTVSRKFGFTCVYIFHTIYPTRNN